MREIKFRAWLIEEKKMVEVLGIDFRNKTISFEVKDLLWQIHLGTRSFDDIIIEQSTGLKDKNGKEIYEGDIVTADYNKAILSVVVFRNGQFVAVSASPAIMIEQHSENLWGTSKLVKIIGNIHENSELLKVK